MAVTVVGAKKVLFRIDASEVGQYKHGPTGEVYRVVYNVDATSYPVGTPVQYSAANASQSTKQGAIVVLGTAAGKRHFAGIVTGDGLPASDAGLVQVQGNFSAILVNKSASSQAAGVYYEQAAGRMLYDANSSASADKPTHPHIRIQATVAASTAAADTAGTVAGSIHCLYY